MHGLYPTQRLVRNPSGHNRANASGQRGAAQPDEAAPARAFSAQPAKHSKGMGHRAESPGGNGESPLPNFSTRAPSTLSQPPAAGVRRRGSPKLLKVRRTAKSVALGLIHFYQTFLSPVLPSSCRYYPSCSVYAYEAIKKWGLGRGAGMALRRLLRCRPFGGRGYDPVP